MRDPRIDPRQTDLAELRRLWEAAVLWAKGTFYPTREKAEAEADRLNKIEQYVYGNRKEAPNA